MLRQIYLSEGGKNLEAECCGEYVEICGVGPVGHTGEDSLEVRFQSPWAQDSPEGLVWKRRFSFNESGWGLGICISNGLPGSGAPAGLGPHCEEENSADKACFQQQQAGALVSGEGCEHYYLEARMPPANVTYKVIKVMGWLAPWSGTLISRSDDVLFASSPK